MATTALSTNMTQTQGQFASPLQMPAMPTRPPDKLPNQLDITKHIEDVNGITNMHIHSIGHNSDAIEFIGSKDHSNYTQWPITSEMSNIISSNNNLNRKYQPLVIPYSSACYMCNENKNKRAKKISIIVLIVVVCIVIIFTIIFCVNKNSNNLTKKEQRKEDRKDNSEDRKDNRKDGYISDFGK
jgi:t-SNARE complex subunit (syntaxin)